MFLFSVPAMKVSALRRKAFGSRMSIKRKTSSTTNSKVKEGEEDEDGAKQEDGELFLIFTRSTLFCHITYNWYYHVRGREQKTIYSTFHGYSEDNCELGGDWKKVENL